MGYVFEKAIRLLTEEVSRRGNRELALTEVVRGYWNKSVPPDDSIEIDLVAIGEEQKIIRFGSCKRTAEKHDGLSLKKFEHHISRFLATREGHRFLGWDVQKALYSPGFNHDGRRKLEGLGYLVLDLDDFARSLSHFS